MSKIRKLLNVWFATMPAIVGLSLLIRPELPISLFFNKPPMPAIKTEMFDILLKGFAIRDIYMGIVSWAALATGSRKMTGWSLLAGAAVVVVDGFALNENLGRGMFDHYAFLPVVVPLGICQAFF